jgi:hypothetical protein
MENFEGRLFSRSSRLEWIASQIPEGGMPIYMLTREIQRVFLCTQMTAKQYTQDLITTQKVRLLNGCLFPKSNSQSSELATVIPRRGLDG